MHHLFVIHPVSLAFEHVHVSQILEMRHAYCFTNIQGPMRDMRFFPQIFLPNWWCDTFCPCNI